MLFAFEVFTLFVTAIAMSLTLAHALEFPGKRRLDEQTYTAVQRIYYPGFTLGGIAEPTAAISALLLLLLTRNHGGHFDSLLISFIALLAMHAVFWLITQPVNRYWLRNSKLSKSGAKFFGTGRINAGAVSDIEGRPWRSLRDRWEYSHLVRAFLSVIAFIGIAIATTAR